MSHCSMRLTLVVFLLPKGGRVTSQPVNRAGAYQPAIVSCLEHLFFRDDMTQSIDRLRNALELFQAAPNIYRFLSVSWWLQCSRMQCIMRISSTLACALPVLWQYFQCSRMQRKPLLPGLQACSAKCIASQKWPDHPSAWFTAAQTGPLPTCCNAINGPTECAALLESSWTFINVLKV